MKDEVTRIEHLEWCKKRAFEYLDNGDYQNAILSFCSDMQKHVATVNHPALPMMLFMCRSIAQTREFIKGFN